MNNEHERDRDLLSEEYLFQTFDEHRGFDIDPDFTAGTRVPVPRKPSPPDSAIALPEPDDEQPS